MVKPRRSINLGNYLLTRGIDFQNYEDWIRWNNFASFSWLWKAASWLYESNMIFRTLHTLRRRTYRANKGEVGNGGFTSRVSSWRNMVRITSNGGYDDGLSMRRQRIRTKFGTKISWGMSIERLKRRSMDNISIHIRDLVNMGDGSTGSKLYCLVGSSITALNL